MTDSPLAEANQFSIEELFNKDPLELQKVDIDKLIEHYRGERKAWTVTETKKRNTPKPKAAPAANQLTLEDILSSMSPTSSPQS